MHFVLFLLQGVTAMAGKRLRLSRLALVNTMRKTVPKFLLPLLLLTLSLQGREKKLLFQKAFEMGGGLSGEITQDKDGFLLLGSWGAGMGIYDGSGLRYIKAGPDSLPSNSVMDIFVDSSGLIWIGTYSKGVSRFDGTTFSNFTATAIRLRTIKFRAAH